MSSVYIAGTGVVSPAGWGLAAFREALRANAPLPTREVPGPGPDRMLTVRTVPPLTQRPAYLAHARLRRTSAISQYAAFAAHEALGADVDRAAKGELEIGVILAVTCGCVIYSRRFYDESLKNPATASPLLFPETVFNAPASHVATLLGTEAPSYTFMGDQGTVLVGLATAAQWLTAGQLHGCLVIGAEEMDWLVGYASMLFDPESVPSEGAGALYLKYGSPPRDGVALEAVTDPFLYSRQQPRAAAAVKMRTQLQPTTEALLCDGTQAAPKSDKPEAAVWSDWRGPKLSPKKVLGEGLTAAAAWQCIAAADAISAGQYRTACVSVVGCNQQAVGAILTSANTTP